MIAAVMTIGVAMFVASPSHAQTSSAPDGCPIEVTWDSSSSDTVSTVNILLVNLAGDTLATLASATDNDGMETVDIPCSEVDTMVTNVRVVANIEGPFDISTEQLIITSTPPTVDSSAEGGSVDEDCEGVVTFSAIVDDDCFIDAQSVTVIVGLVGETATLGDPDIGIADTTDVVEVTGSVAVTGLTSSPAQVIITITATDNCDNETVVVDTAEVVDDTPPTVTCPEGVVVECNSPGGVSADDPQLVAFFAGFSAEDNCDSVPAVSNDAPALFPLGRNVVEFTATDASGNMSMCTSTVHVVDTTPPDIEIVLNRNYLWPPNHKFHEIVVDAEISDSCDPSPTLTLISVESNEPKNGKGDGNTKPDIRGANEGSADTTFELRAERSGKGDGRKYTIIYSASDDAGNSAADTAYVVVPHDQGGHAKASNGFDGLGTGFDAKAERFVLIVPSHNNNGTPFDATKIKANHAQIGNIKGAVSPEEAFRGDVTGDGIDDAVIAYPKSMAEELHLKAKGHQDKTSMHYVDDRGNHFVVYDIFDLGQPVEVDLSTLEPFDGSPEDTELPGDDTADDDAPNGNVPTGTAAQKNTKHLLVAHPNPFNPQTTISYSVPQAGPATVRIYDLNGRLVRTLINENTNAGDHTTRWDGRNDAGEAVASGVYFVQLKAVGGGVTKKVVMLK